MSTLSPETNKTAVTSTTAAAVNPEATDASSTEGAPVATTAGFSDNRTYTDEVTGGTTLLSGVNITSTLLSPSHIGSDFSTLSSSASTESEEITTNEEQPTRDSTTTSQFRTSVSRTAIDSSEGRITAVITTTEHPTTTNGDIEPSTTPQSDVGIFTSEMHASTRGARHTTEMTQPTSTLSAADMDNISTLSANADAFGPSATRNVPTTTSDNITTSHAPITTPYSPSWTGVSYTPVPGVNNPRSSTTLFPPYQGFSIDSVSDAVPLIVACVTSTFVLGSIVFVICVVCCRRCRDSKESYSTIERRHVIDAYESNHSPSATHSSRTLPLRNMKPRPHSNAGVIMAYDNQVFNNTFPRRPPPPSHLPPMIPDYQNYRPGGAQNARPGGVQNGGRPRVLPKQYLPDGSRSLPRHPAEDLHKGRLSLAKGKARPSDVRPYALDQPSSYATLPSNRMLHQSSLYLDAPQRSLYYNQSSC